jgi:hypothetical protein
MRIIMAWRPWTVTPASESESAAAAAAGPGPRRTAALGGGALIPAFTAAMRAAGYTRNVLAAVPPPPITSIALARHRSPAAQRDPAVVGRDRATSKDDRNEKLKY